MPAIRTMAAVRRNKITKHEEKIGTIRWHICCRDLCVFPFLSLECFLLTCSIFPEITNIKNTTNGIRIPIQIIKIW